MIECVNGLGEGVNSRAGLSILAYCYFHAQKYEEAATCYEQLSNLIPKIHKYKYLFISNFLNS